MSRIRAQEAALAQAAAAKLGVSISTHGSSDASDTTSEAAVAHTDSSKQRKNWKAKGKNGAVAAAAPGSQDQQQHHQQQQQADKTQPPTKRHRIVIEPRMADAVSAEPFVPTPKEGWWGAGRFVSVGCLEGLAQEAAKACDRTTFDEDMQVSGVVVAIRAQVQVSVCVCVWGGGLKCVERANWQNSSRSTPSPFNGQANIYNAAQASKTQGKVGLGQSTRTVKVGGVKWEGKKVTFEDGAAVDEEDCGEGGEAAAAIADDDGSGRGTALHALASSTALDELATAERQQQQQQQQPEGWHSAVKWRKVIAAQLTAAPGGTLRLKALQRAVVATVLAKHGSIVMGGKASVKAAFMVRLLASSRFVVEGKHVRLVDRS